MAARDLDLSKISQFIGPNNRDEETAVAPNVLRELSDADLTKAGKIRSRKGYTEALVPCTLGHSLWADHRMHALNPDLTTELVRTGLSRGLDVSYARINDAVFWSNSAECGMVTDMGEAMPWSCEHPSGQPVLTAVEGALGKGQVQVAITFGDRRCR